MVDSHSQILGWVKDAYPEGVPAEDTAALIATLRLRLGSSRAMQVALHLVAAGSLPAEVAGERKLAFTFGDAGLVRGPKCKNAAQIVAWLREGYPSGVPEHDYVPLLALLNRRLTRGEVKKVAKALRRASIAPASAEDIAAAITDVTHTDATDLDLQRVRERLAAKGWPVDFPDPDGP